MAAVVEALEQVGGDLSDGQRRFQAALARVELPDAPSGPVRLDERRQAIAPAYLARFERQDDGSFAGLPFRTIANVEQTFGGYFTPDSPPPGRDSPECRRGNPPAWAR